MAKPELTSLELHLDYQPGEVIEVRKIKDVGCGIYPCYYIQKDDCILISTSVTELISELNSFEIDQEFNPPNFLNHEKDLLDGIVPKLPNRVRSIIPSFVGPMLQDAGFLHSQTHWYYTTKTADSRISVLRPFEKVSPDKRNQNFTPTYSLNNQNEFIEESSRYIKSFVNSIEREYPDHHHVVRMGGRDSQLIGLVPKVSDRWSVFSADPNYPIVDEFIERNNINIEHFFRHDNKNEESWNEFRKKIICSDLRSDPRHLRWYPTLKNIVEKFDGKCIFWIGTIGDTINRYNNTYHGQDDYFQQHFTRGAKGLSATHQVTKNYTGAAALSPYHSPDIWQELYKNYNPDMISKDTDLRPKIASQWDNDSNWWPEQNPSPDPYEYNFESDPREIYYDYIKELLHEETNSIISN